MIKNISSTYQYSQENTISNKNEKKVKKPQEDVGITTTKYNTFNWEKEKGTRVLQV